MVFELLVIPVIYHRIINGQYGAKMRKPIFRTIAEWKDRTHGPDRPRKGFVIFDEESEIIASNVNIIKKGETTAESSHIDQEEVYVVMSGKGRIRVHDEVNEVGPGTVIYIPRHATHQSTGVSDENFVFVCVAIYFDRKPV